MEDYYNNNNNNKVFIDLQGFKSNSNNFIAKEVAVVFINNNNNQHINFILKSPFDFKCLSAKKQKEANWLTKNYHHLTWHDGTVSYQSVCKFLKSNVMYSTVYVKGEEKRVWLQKMLQKRIFNIEDIGCINFKQMENKYPEYFYCNYHTHGICALRNAFLLSKEIVFLK